LNDVEVPDDFGIILVEVLDLAADGLLEVLLQSEHIRDVAVDGFGGVARHDCSTLK
jgi:hypothetical protein